MPHSIQLKKNETLFLIHKGFSAKNVGTAFSSTGTITWLVAFDAYWI